MQNLPKNQTHRIRISQFQSTRPSLHPHPQPKHQPNHIHAKKAPNNMSPGSEKLVWFLEDLAELVHCGGEEGAVN